LCEFSGINGRNISVTLKIPRLQQRTDFLKTGIRKIERMASVSHHTIRKILKGETVRRNTLAKVVKEIDRTLVSRSKESK